MKEKRGKKKQNYFTRSINTYADAFKSVRWDILLMAVYDLLFFFIVFLLGKDLFFKLFNSTRELSAIRPPEMFDMPAVIQSTAAIKQFFFSMGFDIFAAILIAIFIYSIFKSLIWARVRKRKIEWFHLSRFFLLSVGWFIAWTLICVIAYFLLSVKGQQAVYLVVAILLLYLTPLMNISFTKTLKMWKSAKYAFQLGIGNIHKFIVPCILSLLTLIVIYYILAFVLNALKIGPSIGLIILIIYVLLYLAWNRIYLNLVVERIR